jgi:hypothetical protein
VKLVAAVVPNWTAVTPMKLVPVMLTRVLPVLGPEVGLMTLTVGIVPAAPTRGARVNACAKKTHGTTSSAPAVMISARRRAADRRFPAPSAIA